MRLLLVVSVGHVGVGAGVRNPLGPRVANGQMQRESFRRSTREELTSAECVIAGAGRVLDGREVLRQPLYKVIPVQRAGNGDGIENSRDGK